MGIKLARDLALTRVIFEMDSKVVVHMISSGATSTCSLQPLLHEIVSLLKLSDWEASVVHTYREGNKCANILANLGHGSSFLLTILDDAPPSLFLPLLEDAMVCSTSRLVSSSVP